MGSVRENGEADVEHAAEAAQAGEAQGKAQIHSCEEMTLRLRIYELLATPAHLWLWVCARLVGGRFECGPVDDDEAAFD